MCSVRKFAVLFCLLGAACGLGAQSTQPAMPGRVVLVLPFENRSGNASLNWIGESFPDTLDARLDSVHFLTLSQDDRNFAYEHLGLPAGFRPSRATTIRIAQQLDADFVIIGSYNIATDQAVTGATQPEDRITIQAQVLDVRNFTLSPPVEDGTPLPKLYDAENAIAWKVARVLDPHLNVAEQTFLSASGAVPLSSFENYIRGTNAPTAAEKLHRLTAAVNDSPGYSRALLALGKEQYAERDYAAAARTLARVPLIDRLALEANFYLGLANFNAANYAAAGKAFAFVASQLPLPEVINDEGVAAARQGQNATQFFRQSSQSDPNDEDYHYNLSLALFRQGNLAEAAREADAALALKPADNEALELRARLKLALPGQKLLASDTGFSPLERIVRTYSEAGFRQAAFQLDQMRSMRLATMAPAERVAEYVAQGHDYLSRGLLPEAEEEFSDALAVNAQSAAALAGVAEVRERSGALADARSEALASNRMQPNVNAWLVLARLDLAQNLTGAAGDDVDNALKLEPRNAAALNLQQSIRGR